MADFTDKASFEDVVCKKATDKALLVSINGDDYWVPQSQVDDDSEVYREGDSGELVVSEWWAEKEGLL